ncbi:MAG: endolytic transglycosylase MltG [Bacteroidales bacterium]|nr:endolytic transglycosylase MltG [Bacteroidales bacterium]
MANRKKTKLILLSLTGVGLLLAILLLFTLFAGNTRKNATIYISQDATYAQLMDSLQKYDVLKNKTTFKWTCKLLFYKKIKPGKYTFEENESNFSMVMKLRRGQHYPVKFTFNNVRTKDQLLKKLSNKSFFFEWNDFYKLLNDKQFLKNYVPFGDTLTPETVIAIFRPDTYEFYYDISEREFFDKMYNHYRKFWTEERRKKAEEIGLTPMEVSTLASIVEEENHQPEEQPIIAGLYMNRLHKGMMLQADPTVIFANNDFTIKRVTEKHLTVKSPYNTYRYQGLPPGPIRIPATCAIDAVLNYNHNNYLYMCAKEDFSGKHNFTDNYKQHLQNARRYQAALNQQNKKK